MKIEIYKLNKNDGNNLYYISHTLLLRNSRCIYKNNRQNAINSITSNYLFYNILYEMKLKERIEINLKKDLHHLTLENEVITNEAWIYCKNIST